jgi:hypothetical protein
VRVWTGSSWLRIGTAGGHFECGSEPSGSIKCCEFLDQPQTGSLLKSNCAVWSE